MNSRETTKNILLIIDFSLLEQYPKTKAMKIDNIDVNKEKSPDKAERTASIEDIKKTQSKFFDFASTLNNTTADRNLLDTATESSKLKKLLLNSNPEVANLNELKTNGSSVVDNNGVKSEDLKSDLSLENEAKSKNAKQKLFLCSECDEHFLKVHLFNHMKNVHNKFTCLYCYGFFEKIERLQQHLVRKHKVQNVACDEQTLINSFSDKVINAVCCKCASILNISENKFHSHQCDVSSVNVGGGVKSSAITNNKRKYSNSLAVQNQQLEKIENGLVINNHNSVATAKKQEDLYCEQAIHHLLQQQQPPNIKNSFNGGKYLTVLLRQHN